MQIRSADQVAMETRDEDVLVLYTDSGCFRGHWYEDHMLNELAEWHQFGKIGEHTYVQLDV